MKKIKITTALAAAATLAISMPAKAVELINPLGDLKDPRVIIGNIIAGVLGLVGTVALVLFIYGGITLMLSQGDSGKVKKGRDTMLWAALGLAVIFSSYALVRYVLTSLTGQ